MATRERKEKSGGKEETKRKAEIENAESKKLSVDRINFVQKKFSSAINNKI